MIRREINIEKVGFQGHRRLRLASPLEDEPGFIDRTMRPLRSVGDLAETKRRLEFNCQQNCPTEPCEATVFLGAAALHSEALINDGGAPIDKALLICSSTTCSFEPPSAGDREPREPTPPLSGESLELEFSKSRVAI